MRGKNLLGYFAGTVFALLLVEVFLQVIATTGVLAPQARSVPHPELGRSGNPRFHEHDTRGFRNDRALDRASVVVIGDSHVYGSSVPSSAKWSSLLEQHLGKPVYNISFGGLSPHRNRENFKTALSLKPAQVFYGVYFGNDFYDDFRQAFKEGNCDPECRLAFDHERANPIKENPGTQIFRTLSSKPAGWTARIRAFLNKYSETYKILIRVKDMLAPDLRLLAPKFETVVAAIKQADRTLVCPHDGEWKTVLTPGYRGFVLDRADPRIMAGFRLGTQAITDFAKAATKKGVKFSVVLIPTKELVFASRSRIDCPALGPMIDNERWFRTRFIARLKKAGIPLIDPLPDLIAADQQPYFENADGHPNPLGHTVIARTVRKAIFDQ